MASVSKRQEGSDDFHSTLDADIQVLNHAKDDCGIPPALDASDFPSALLDTIGVRFLPFRDDEPQSHVHAGRYGQRTVLRGSWPVMR